MAKSSVAKKASEMDLISAVDLAEVKAAKKVGQSVVLKIALMVSLKADR